jgi:hypothetical protein
VQQFFAAYPPDWPEGGGEERDYAELWAGLAAGLEEAIERVTAERQAAEGLLAELLATPTEVRAARIGAEARFRTLAVAYLLFERSLAVSEADTAEAEHLALLGIFLLSRLDFEEAPQLLVHELKARGWALVANACFQAGDWASARMAIERADSALAEAGYVVHRPGIRRLVAKIRVSERHAEELFELVARAVNLLLRALVGDLPRPLLGEAAEPTGPPKRHPAGGTPSPSATEEN